MGLCIFDFGWNIWSFGVDSVFHILDFDICDDLFDIKDVFGAWISALSILDFIFVKKKIITCLNL